MPFKSPYPEVDIPEVDLWSYFFDRPQSRQPEDRKLFIDPQAKRAYTFSDCHNLSLSLGKALKSTFDLPKGSRIGFFAPNNVDTPITTWAVLWAGYVACPANPQYTVAELVHQLTDAKVQAIITVKELLPTATAAAKKAGLAPDRIILMGHERDDKTRHWTDLKAAKPDTIAREPVGHNDLAFVVYSSGTTGLPKGVALTHRNIVANLLQHSVFDWYLLYPSRDSTLSILPFYHIFGLVVVMFGASFSGIPVYIIGRFDLETACKLIQEHRISVLFVPPPIILGLTKSPVVSKYDLRSLRWITSGAAPLTRELAEGLWNRLKVGTKQGYGLSETSPVICTQMPDEWGKFVGSVGQLAPNVEAKIVNENGKEVPNGTPGEFLVKGPNVFSGYLNRPELNTEVFTEDGFFKTGDVVYKTDLDVIYVTDRAKELIKYKGFQVAPAELEGLLVDRAEIIDACVIGVMDHSQATEVPRAYLVARPGTEPSDALTAEISTWLASKVAPYKKLRGGIRWIKEVPKSPSGKIMRRIVKEWAKKEETEAKL
ncbi:4-coumarate--CoA ligase 2 [Ceratocystis fimbriata CBS 114723]|uniref:4-coumarate--CoA ligase 2 n=1 Tax=Ceratocystis fimbriata CBS 114723 TaxID=1035309 RepID=A0A2C5WVX1_9PEZI|nr:4-coumarate--CoA ligase 2 [Ceratocystis fimbriata CBS 114723]